MRNMGNIGNVDALRREREARKNPPEYEVGQGSGDDWSIFDDIGSSSDMDSAFKGSDFGGGFDSFGGSSFGGNSNFGGSGFGVNSFGGSNNFGGGFNFQNGNNQMNSNSKSTEDQIFDAMVVAGKNSVTYTKDVVKSVESGLQESNPFFWTTYGSRLLKVGGVTTGTGVVFWLLGLVTNYFSGGFWVTIGGLLTTAIGLIIFSLNYEEADAIKADNVEPVLEDSVGGISEDSPWDIEFDNNPTNDSWGVDEPSEDPWSLDEPEDDPWANWGSDTSDSGGDDYDVWSNLDDLEPKTEGVYEGDINIESAIEGIRQIPAHTQTRAYLFEEFSRVLPLINPEFSRLKEISENSDNFIIFDKILVDAAIQVKTKEEDLPELLELRENSFIIQLKATRPPGLKVDEIAKEIASIYSKDERDGSEHEGIYATTSTVGSIFFINIFKGEDSVISLADTYREVKDYILDTNNKKPVVIGVNELGKVWKFDADNVNSYIFSGKGRSGKSWAVVSLVLQLCMYSSPKEVSFEALDIKNMTSDYYSMNMHIPHFKNFEGTPQGLLKRLRYITTTEATRRGNILNKHGKVNIKDLKRSGIDVEMPYHYIIIDEIYSLQEALSKDEYNDFKIMVNTIITKMPNLGLRVILVPHRIVNDVIPKTTYTLSDFTACVKSEFSEVSNALGVKERDFPYTLVTPGDMALKTSEINRGKSVFNHGVAITTTNEGNEDIYKFVGSIWNMLEPSKEEEEVVTLKEQYTGHKLEGVEDSVEEDFWASILD